MTSTAMTRSPFLTLNNGVQMPALRLDVFQSPPDETAEAVESAITHGYRLIDTAAAYFNERQVGEGLADRASGAMRYSSKRRCGSANITLEPYGREIPEP